MNTDTIESGKDSITLKADFLIEKVSAFRGSISDTGNARELRKVVSSEFTDLCKEYMVIGNELFEQYSQNPLTHFPENYILLFSAPEYFKDLAFLSRDVILQLDMAHIRLLEDLVSNEAVEDHSQKSGSVLVSASEKFIENLSSEKDRLLQFEREQKKIAAILRHQANPWPVYKSQFSGVIEQINKILAAQILLIKTTEHFNRIKKIIEQVEQNNDELNELLCSRVSEILENVTGGDNESVVIAKIEDALHEQGKHGNDQLHFTAELTHEINLLGRIEVPIRSNEGILKTREVQLKKIVQKWFDFGILPLFIDLIAQEANARAKFQASLLNVENTLRHSKNLEANLGTNPSIRTLETLFEELKVHRKAGRDISQSISSNLHSELLVSNLFGGQPFLEVSINDAISSTLDIGKNKLVQKLKNYYHRVLFYFNSKYRDSVFQGSFSAIEITTKCIAHRMYKEENEHYDTLFLSKNFIGDLFLITRKQQDKKLAESIEQWNNGFPKAALVFGDRLSGRTTFVNTIAKKYFGPDVVLLQPESTSIIDGRKFSTTYNLGEAMEYITKYNSKSTRPIIVIDDLEFWHDASVSLLDNIRSLTDFVESESDDAYVVAVCTESLRHHLDKRLHFSDVFSTHIDTSRSDRDEILEAILLRHGAGHRTLISENGEPISNSKIRSLAFNMAKHYHGNMGEVLQAWTFNTFIQEGQKVLFSKKEYEFLDYFSKEELIILKQASLFRKINEHGLRKVSPRSYETHYKSAVKRLINSKVLLRDPQGNLYLNPVTLFDIRKILHRKQYLST